MLDNLLLDYISICVFATQFTLVVGAYALWTSRRIGGLRHWRVGSIGGSFYRAAGAREMSEQT